MLIRSYGASALAVLALVCLLAGCDDAPPEQTGTAAAAPAPGKAPTGPTLANLPPDMVAAVSAGKTATSIGVHFALRGSPTVGVPLSVDISLVPHRKFEIVRALFQSNDGLELTAGDTLEPKENVAAESVIKHHLVLLPAQEGLFMVTAVVDSESDEGNVVRVFSIPVIVGPAAAAAAPAQPAPAQPAPATG
jgi:hypothetical protein